MSYQPIRVVPHQRTADAAHRERDLHRLLAIWRALGARYIAAQAHGGSDEVELADAMAAIEDALQGRHPAISQAIQADMHTALVEAEHIGEPLTPRDDCLVCRRITGGLPISIGHLLPSGRVR